MPDSASTCREPVHVGIGRQLRRLRLARCWTTEWVAAQLGLTENAVNGHEAGTWPLAVDELAGYTQLFGVRVATFFRDPSQSGQVVAFPRRNQDITDGRHCTHLAATASPEAAHKPDNPSEPATIQHFDGIAAATMALSTACRKLEANLAALIAHCNKADSALSDITAGATTAATSAAAIGRDASDIASRTTMQ
jgi:transcriptional regulator with XRE-family HTH domain